MKIKDFKLGHCTLSLVVITTLIRKIFFKFSLYVSLIYKECIYFYSKTTENRKQRKSKVKFKKVSR